MTNGVPLCLYLQCKCEDVLIPHLLCLALVALTEQLGYPSWPLALVDLTTLLQERLTELHVMYIVHMHVCASENNKYMYMYTDP